MLRNSGLSVLGSLFFVILLFILWPYIWYKEKQVSKTEPTFDKFRDVKPFDVEDWKKRKGLK